MKWAVILALLALAACDKAKPTSGAPGSASAATTAVAAPGRAKIDTAEIAVPPGKSDLHVAWSVPADSEINDEAPFAVRWSSSDGLVAPPADIKGHGSDVRGGFDVPIEIMPDASGGKLTGDIDLVLCDAVTHKVCVPIKRRLELTFATGAKGSPKGTVTLPLPSAKP